MAIERRRLPILRRFMARRRLHPLPIHLRREITATIRPLKETIQQRMASTATIRRMDLSSPLRRLMMPKALLAAVLLVAACDTAFANWWIVRASDGTCLVVDIEPTGKNKGVTKIGKDVYQTPDQAEADVKRLCKEPKPAEPGKAE